MHKLLDLKEMIIKELEDQSGSKELTASSLDMIDKLAHAGKNICKIIEACEEEYSGYEGESYNDYRGRSMRGMSRTSESSYRRGRDSMGRFTSRASYGSGMIDNLYEIMENADSEETKRELKRLIAKMEK